jgi:pyrimidine operon attenuation protein/uracil phosphoribosyltransferase
MVNKKDKAILLDRKQINKTLIRLAHEIIEKNFNLDNVAIIGIRTRGDIIANRLYEIIKQITGSSLDLGSIDVTFYRDDFETNLGSPKIGPSNILFNINKKDVILIDDVLYTGRTIRAAMEEIFSLGRPDKIQLAVLIDRGHRELPIKANYVGKNYPTSFNEHVHVYLDEVDNEESVKLLEYNEQA